jgi:TolA-binding protein
MAQARIGVLKNLDRYETLLADNQVQRNKDDAQFQIGRIVNAELQNPVKAIAEFRKVVSKYPKSEFADDAQLEIGKALLALGKLEDARKELRELPVKYPNSALADDALFLVGQSYEQQAVRLAGITQEKAKAEAFERGQRGAYSRFNEQVSGRASGQQQRRDKLKKAGDGEALALDEASNAALELNFRQEGISQTAKIAEQQAETESAIEVANRQDRINEAYREAVAMYAKAASDYPLGDKTDESLLKIAQIFETQLKDRAAAMQTYQKIVKLFPGTPVAEDAAWKVAQFHERESKYTAAAEAYRDFIRNYPGSARVADAQFALAEVLEQLGNWVDAMDAYETFRQKFGSHPKAQLAMEQINWIKAYRK